MKRAHLLTSAPLFLIAACAPGGQGTFISPPSQPYVIPAVAVNDPCSAYSTSTACGATVGKCTWTQAGFNVPGMTTRPAACVTASACAGLNFEACSGNGNCSWSGVTLSAAAPALCPIGRDDCSSYGYCFDRPPAGSVCHCLQPLVCPSNLACPAVQCDCPPPEVADGGSPSAGGGTCTCACPVCAPGETCPPCDCSCEGGSGGGSDGGCGTGTGNAGAGPGVCTCNCPECPAGATCPACSCACTTGSTTTMTAAPSSSGTASASTTGSGGSAAVSVCGCPACSANTACAPCGCGTEPADPCTAYTDAASCTADTADECGWTSLSIACFTTPCPTGSCARMTPIGTPDAGNGSDSSGKGGGCGCSCPACTDGQTCPPCVCNCCPEPSSPVTLQPSGGAPSTGG